MIIKTKPVINEKETCAAKEIAVAIITMATGLMSFLFSDIATKAIIIASCCIALAFAISSGINLLDISMKKEEREYYKVAALANLLAFTLLILMVGMYRAQI